MKNKILRWLIIIVLIFSIFKIELYADDINVDNWKPSVSATNNTKITSVAGKILGVIQVCGTIISVTTLIIIGIKYMCGSIEEKVQYRKSMVPYLVGSILVFCTTNIASIIYAIATSSIK